MGHFDISLDRRNFYSPGQIVSGRVTLTLVEPEADVKCLYLQCIGKANVEWNKGKWGYQNNETYFNHKTSLNKTIEGIRIQPTDGLCAGIYRFPFFFKLPPGIPSSYEGIGTIRYFCKARLERTGLFTGDISSKIEIPVWRVQNLNEFPELAIPSEISNETFLCCICCKEGPIGFNLWFPRTCFQVGERIQFDLHMYNWSSKDILEVKVELIQIEEWIDDSDLQSTKSDSTRLGTSCLPGVRHGQEVRAMMAVDLIPSLFQPISLAGCSFVKLTYKFKIEMILPRGFDLSSSLPVTIGVVPFPRHPQ